MHESLMTGGKEPVMSVQCFARCILTCSWIHHYVSSGRCALTVCFRETKKYSVQNLYSGRCLQPGCFRLKLTCPTDPSVPLPHAVAVIERANGAFSYTAIGPNAQSDVVGLPIPENRSACYT